MKRIIVLLLAVVLLTSCAAPAASEKHSSLEAAKQILVETKEKTAETVKPEYFESDEWKAFVDAYWDGYNKGQESMKDPEYMDKEAIEY